MEQRPLKQLSWTSVLLVQPLAPECGSLGCLHQSTVISFLLGWIASSCCFDPYSTSMAMRNSWFSLSSLCTLARWTPSSVSVLLKVLYWAIYKLRVPGSSRNGSGSRTSASGTSALSDNGLSNQLPLLPPARSHGTPLTFNNKAPSQRANSGFLRRLTTQ